MGTDFKSLPDLFEASIARFSDNPLFGEKSDGSWHWLSYGEFGEQVAQARAGLAGIGVAAGARVAAIADNRVEWAGGAYGTDTLGSAWVPRCEAERATGWASLRLAVAAQLRASGLANQTTQEAPHRRGLLLSAEAAGVTNGHL